MTLNDIVEFAQIGFAWLVTELVFVPIAWSCSDQAFLDTPISILLRVIILFCLIYGVVAYLLAYIVYGLEIAIRFVIRRPKKRSEVVSEGSFLYYVVIVISFFISAVYWDSLSQYLNS